MMRRGYEHSRSKDDDKSLSLSLSLSISPSLSFFISLFPFPPFPSEGKHGYGVRVCYLVTGNQRDLLSFNDKSLGISGTLRGYLPRTDMARQTLVQYIYLSRMEVLPSWYIACALLHYLHAGFKQAANSARDGANLQRGRHHRDSEEAIRTI